MMQRFQLLRPQSVNKKGHARYVSAWAAKAGHKSKLDRINAIRKHHRDFRSGRFGSDSGFRSAGREDDRHLTAH
jgi:hypothetical protein